MAAPMPAKPTTPPTTPPPIAAVFDEWCAVDPEPDAADDPAAPLEAAPDEATPEDVGTFGLPDPVTGPAALLM